MVKTFKIFKIVFDVCQLKILSRYNLAVVWNCEVYFLVTKICNSFCLYFADSASQYIYLNINQLDVLNFIMSLFHVSTCFEHMCSSSGGQNLVH